MRLTELLRGYVPDINQVQMAGNMIVVPVVSTQEFTSENVDDVSSVKLDHDQDYGHMSFKNEGYKIGILMQGATIMTKQEAQDRTVPRAQLIGAKSKIGVDVYCVQPDQGGHINTERLDKEFQDDPIPYRMLPPALRASAFTTSHESTRHSYDSMWSSIEHYSSGFSGIRNRRSMKGVYGELDTQLEEFVAQFEPVDQQMGAIVFINGRLVAVDLMPTYKSWSMMWRTLIRDSYGMEALRSLQHDGAGAQIWDIQVNMEAINDIESLVTEITNSRTGFVEAIRKIWNEHDEDINTSRTQSLPAGGTPVEMHNLDSNRFMGQAVMHDAHCVYLSLLPKGSTREDQPRFRQRTYNDSPFRF